MFVLFRSPVYPNKFKYYLNSKYRNITFTCEKQHNSSMPFLDILITRASNGFKTPAYHKPTLNRVYPNFNRFISEKSKVGLILTLTTHRTAREGRGPSFIPLYHFHPLTNIQIFICNFACEMTITYF